MCVIDANEKFIGSGAFSRYAAGDPYAPTSAELSEVLNDALDGKPVFINGDLASHTTIIGAEVKELFDLAKAGLLRRAVEDISDAALSSRFHRIMEKEDRTRRDV